MIVVSDTSPLNYLVLVGVTDILPAIFGRVLIPEQVRVELSRPQAPEAVRNWIQIGPSWLEVVQGVPESFLELDSGESAALSLARSVGCELLVDESDARAIARSAGVAVVGTIGILERAAIQGLIDLEAAFDRLRATSFRGSDSLYRNSLERCRTYREGS